MQDGAEIAKAVETWLAQFERALTTSDTALLSRLFVRDSYWRDVLAFDWRIRTITGADNVQRELLETAARSRPAAFEIAADRTPPRRVTRAGAETIEAIFKFETAKGRGSGVVRLIPQSGNARLTRPGRCSPHSTRSRVTKKSPGVSATTARPIRAISADRIGSTCGKRLPRTGSRSGRSGYRWRTGRTVGCGLSRTIAGSTR